jgi:Zn(2)-Cys(6) binuclear cluster domain-containing protein
MLSMNNTMAVCSPPPDFNHHRRLGPFRRPDSTCSLTLTTTATTTTPATATVTTPLDRSSSSSSSSSSSFAVESPSSSGDSQSHVASSIATDDSPDDLSSMVWPPQLPATRASHKFAGRRRSEPLARINITVISSPADSDMSMDTVIPKVEEVDEDEELHSKSAEAENNADETPGVAPAPRKRGRPRKHPLPAPGGQVKVAKGRSKTGCITCRRRKKKCDETKPACLNCQKNAVVCEGYPPKEIWKSGKQKMEDGISSIPLFFFSFFQLS